MKKSMFVLGASGFIGSEVVRQALASGWMVKALVRSERAYKQLEDQGAKPILGDAGTPATWISETRNIGVLIDLVQPKVLKRLTLGAVRSVAAERQALTDRVLDALKSLREEERPHFLSISGSEDLAPDSRGYIGSGSKLRSTPAGFGHIGIPVRKMTEASGISATFIHLGTVYGPGKAFGESILPQIAKGKWKIIGNGSNHMPLVHVEDAAGGIIHLAGLDRAEVRQKTFVLADASATTAKELYVDAARMLGAKTPSHAPAWLASLFAGKILVETITQDLLVDPSGLNETGFVFKYPSYREGLPPILEALGYI